MGVSLFTTIAGFVYAIHSVQRGRVGFFLRGKVRRILLPYVSVATLAYLMTALLPFVNEPNALEEIWKIYIFGFDHFWFLQAIFLAFLAVVGLELLRWLERPATWALCLAAASIVFLWAPHVLVFSFYGFLYLMPYFLLGLGLYRFSALLRSKAVIWPVALVAAAGLILQHLVWWTDLSINVEKVGLLAMLVGLTVNVILFRVRRTAPWLARFGFYSYSIYLFHFLGLAVGNRVARGPLDSAGGNFLAQWLLGLSIPIVIEITLRRSKVLRRVFLGLR